MQQTAEVPASLPTAAAQIGLLGERSCGSGALRDSQVRFRAEGVIVKKLYIGNLPFSATEDQLQEWFSQVGVSPSGVNLIRDRFTGQSRGFAFVEINSDEEADRAINSLNGQNFGGRNLVVNEARPQTERSGGGRGGYGGGRGGGGGRSGHGGGRGGDRGDRGDRGNRW
jgi:cold-inducible RNA-binding protein